LPDQLKSSIPAAVLDPVAVDGWIGKAAKLAAPLLEVAGEAASPATVRARRVEDIGEARYGNFMLCWPDDTTEPRLIHHLPDGGFFLELLRRCYAPVLDAEPELAGLLADDSRLEVAFTNDVLQVQLRGQWQPYSMIRHHALMLFHGLLWLDEPVRSGWVRLYEALADHVVAQEGGPPPVESLAAAEAAAFADFERLAARTHDPADAADLLSDTAAMAAVNRYQVLAAIAITVLWRDYQQQAPDARDDWQRRELAEGYGRQDYLTARWQRLLRA
jgi:hypothetical protein